MSEPTTPSGWVVGDGMPGPGRRWAYAFVVLLLAAIVLAIVLGILYTTFGRAWFAAGYAARSIAERDRSQVEYVIQMPLVDGSGGVLVYLAPDTVPAWLVASGADSCGQSSPRPACRMVVG